MPMLAESSIGVPAIVIGTLHGLEDLLRHVRRVLGMAQLGEDDRELVAAEARHRVVVADAVAQPLRHLQQQLVAGGVAERVVDGLEVIEIDEHHRQRACRCAARALMPSARRSVNSLRFGRCVSTSWYAWNSICSSARFRSLMSTTVAWITALALPTSARFCSTQTRAPSMRRSSISTLFSVRGVAQHRRELVALRRGRA